MVELEEQVYRQHGLVTYVADSLLLDILTDTTERAPTFMLPPFRKEGDTIAPVSWAFVKSPCHPTRQAWADLLQREPRGLTWGPEVYQQLQAPLPLQANPPKLDNNEIYKFRIGNEPDPSRTDAPDSMLVFVGSLARHQPSIIHHQYERTAAHHVRADAPCRSTWTSTSTSPAICPLRRCGCGSIWRSSSF